MRERMLSLVLTFCISVVNTFNKVVLFCAMVSSMALDIASDLGLDELLRHCECVVEKLRYPESDPCYQAMAGTAIFTHTAYDMLLNYSR